MCEGNIDALVFGISMIIRIIPSEMHMSMEISFGSRLPCLSGAKIKEQKMFYLL